jgi:hypothetical protein
VAVNPVVVVPAVMHTDYYDDLCVGLGRRIDAGKEEQHCESEQPTFDL